MVTHQLQVERRTAKERWPETDVLPLSHADQPSACIEDKSLLDVIMCCQVKFVKSMSLSLVGNSVLSNVCINDFTIA